MHELIRAQPLATLVTLSSSGLNANHIPLHLCPSPPPFGVLHGHVARANPILNDLPSDIESLAIFHGPQAYITPSWYATQKETGKVVPTWNYAVVHAYGFLRLVDNPVWLRAHLDGLTLHHEASFSDPWAVSDAPQEYIEKIMAHIIGIELVITKLWGKWKVSQNQSSQNQAGVVAGLKGSDLPGALGMAELIEVRAKKEG